MNKNCDSFLYHYFSLFAPNEKNEILRWLIVFLWKFLNDCSDRLFVTPHDIRYTLPDNTSNIFPLKSEWLTNWFIELDKLLEKTDIGQFIKLESMNDQKRIYVKNPITNGKN
jgi:hypothetical protein